MAKKKEKLDSKIAVKKKTIKKSIFKKKFSKKTASPKSVKKVSKIIKAKPTPARLTGGKAKTSKVVANKVKKITAPEIKGPSQILVDTIVEGILDLKGRNISVLDLRGIHNRVCDYYIICQADSNTQVNAIAGSIQETVKKCIGEKAYRSEGFENAEWVLVDYVTVVAHVFQSHIRNFYNLESLWADAEVTEIAFD